MVCTAGCQEVGDTEEQTGDELRQAQQVAEVLLREGDHAEGGGREICLQVCLQSRGVVSNSTRTRCGVGR